MISWCPVKALHDLQHETHYRVTVRVYLAQVSRHVTVLLTLDLDT